LIASGVVSTLDENIISKGERGTMHKNHHLSLGLLVAVAALMALVPQFAFSQQNSYWESVPQGVRDRNAFKRFQWFYRQRAMPEDMIPEGALEMARESEMARELRRSSVDKLLDLSWSSIGPAGVISTYPSQWGVVSGRVRGLAVHPTDPNTAYIGPAAGGIWKTTDGGTTWQDVGANLASLTFGAIAVDPVNPNNVYAGAGESIYYFNTTTYSGKGLYRSTDAGATWTQITSGFGSTTHFSAMKVSPTTPTTIYAALGSGFWHASSPGNEGLWRSTNSGTTWARTGNYADAFDVLPHPTTIDRVYAATGGTNAGFYRSTDNGATWTKITTGLPSGILRMQLALSPSISSTIYALTYTEPGGSGTVAVYKSTDDGSTWAATGATYSSGQGWYDLLIAVNPTNVNEVYIGTDELRRSTDGGATFSYVGGSYWTQAMHVDFHIMAFAPSNASYRYIGCDGGIYRSINGGSTWGNLNGTLPTLQYYRIASHPTDQNILTGGAQDNGIYKTTNGGTGNWTLVSTGDGMECFYDYATPTNVYASTQSGGIKKSTTGGNYGSFASIKPTTTDSWAWTTPFIIHPTIPTTIYAASQRPWRSTDGGVSWTDLTGGALTGAAITSMAQSRVDPNNMILAASEWSTTPPVLISTTGGTSWTNVTANIGGTQRYVGRVVFHPLQAATCFVVRSGFGAGNKVYRSTNLGAAWTNISGDLPDVPHNDLFVDPIIANEIYVANDLGVYRTTNGGTNWTRQGSGLPYVPAMDFDYFSSGGTRLLRVATHGRAAYQAVLGSAPAVQVSVPNGGEVWRIGTSPTIQWNSTSISGNVRVELSRNGGGAYETLFVSIPNDGSEAWLVAGTPTANALVRVVSADNAGVRDSSDLPFSILQPTLALTSPNGGDTLIAGTPVTVQWNSTNLVGNVKLELSRNGGTSWSTLVASTPDDGGESWTPTGPATTQGKVRVRSVDIPSLLDVSDTIFTIVQPALTLVTPNGGESWPVGSAQTLQWTSQFMNGNVRIELSRDGGIAFPETLLANTANDGSEAWTVTGPQSTAARVRVVSIADSTVKSASAGNFSILQPAIAVLSPNGGEDWQVDSVRTIQWSSQAITGDVSIELSRDGGVIYAMLVPVTANDGQEDWTVTSPLTTHARMRIRSVVDSSVVGQSTGDFVISRQSTAQFTASAGWNMLSVPVTVADRRTPQVFPAAVSPAYTFGASGYFVDDTLRYGSGYWLKFGGAQVVSITGNIRPSDTVDVSSGWNMIGSVSATVPVDSIVQLPGGIVTTPFYEFTGTAYAPTDSIKAMRAYWVKAIATGRLVLTMPAGTFKAAATRMPPGQDNRK
jgi:photosystem II stability/assembly factor-like uncharacterized protein